MRGEIQSVSTYEGQRGFQTRLSQMFSRILKLHVPNFIVNISIDTVNLLPRTGLSLISPRNLTSLQKVSLIMRPL